jgi:predicted Rossmann-fold nucleotide-binding protein
MSASHRGFCPYKRATEEAESAMRHMDTPQTRSSSYRLAYQDPDFLMRAKALVAFPGGFGTLDELFETLTLLQTEKVKPFPVLLFGKEFWDRFVRFDTLVEEGTISESDLELFRFVETAVEAWEIIRTFEASTKNS